MSTDTDQVKARLNLAEIISEYVPLKQSGRTLKALCPFHQEKTPSFIVNQERGSWHCFGCNEGGDVFTFIQKIEGLDFPAALKLLAERAGITLSKYQPAPGEKNQRQRLFELLAAAARFYHQLLAKQSIGAKARQYLADRGLTPATIDEFQIGYAPRSWNSLQAWLAKAGFTREEMIAAGLVGQAANGKWFDRFRGRIMFPVTDVQGRVVAFGGRITPWHDSGQEGKYINSPETSLYEKRRTIYSLSRAKVSLRGGQACLVVEGYMDVAMLVQHGITNVVASSGTAFTPEQIQVLGRFTNTLHFAFDADTAGLRAAVAATQAALAAGMQVATVVFPGGKDPAEVAQVAPEKLTEYVSHPQPLVRILLGQLAQHKQSEQLQVLLPFLAAVANPIQQGEMIQEAAAILHVPEATLLGLLAKQQQVFSAPATPAPAQSAPLSVKPERQLMGIIVTSPAARATIFSHITEAIFSDSLLQALHQSLHTIEQVHDIFLSMSADKLIALLPSAQQSLAASLAAQAEDLLRLSSNSPVQEGSQLLALLRRRQLRQQLAELQQQLVSDQPANRQAAIEQFQAVAGQLAQL